MTQDTGAGMPDASMLTPEQQQHYQQAYTQAMQAQQLYAHAQQAYAQAQQQGNEALAHEAYHQAQHAHQMYTQAHQAYQAILQQVEAAQLAAQQAEQARLQEEARLRAEREEAERQAQLAAQREAERLEAERQAQLLAQQQLAAQQAAQMSQQQAPWQQAQQHYSQQQMMAAQQGYAQHPQQAQHVTHNYGQNGAYPQQGYGQHPQQGYPQQGYVQHPTHGYASQSPEMQAQQQAQHYYSQQQMMAAQQMAAQHGYMGSQTQLPAHGYNQQQQQYYSQQQMMAAQQAQQGYMGSQTQLPAQSPGQQQVVAVQAPRQQQVVVANSADQYQAQQNGVYTQQNVEDYLADAEPTLAATSHSDLQQYSQDYMSASQEGPQPGESLADVWGVEAAEFSPQKRGSSWFFWIMFLLFIGGGGYGVYVMSNPTRPKDPFANKPKKPVMSDKEKRELAAFKEALLREKNTRYLRPLSFSKTKQELAGLSIAGTGECRSLYLLGKNKKSWVTEGGVNRKSPDYVQKPYTDRPMQLKSLGVPGRVSFHTVVRGLYRDYLIVRTKLSGKRWMAIFPLVGNPINYSRKKGNKRSELVCGDSKVTTYIRRDKMLLFGYGACELGERSFGAKPWGCHNMDLPRSKTIGVFLNDRSLRSRRPRGYVLLGRQQLRFSGRRVRQSDNELLALRLKYATPLSFQTSKRRWIGMDKRTGKLFALDSRLKIKELDIKIPVKPKRVLGVKLSKKQVRVVLRDRLADYDLDRKKKTLSLSAKYLYGDNISVKRIAWGHSDKVLLLYTRRFNVYQFSDNP